MSSLKVTIIGTGNLAQHLARIFEKKGIDLQEMYGRDLQKLQQLSASFYDLRYTQDLDFSKSPASVYFLCVSDNAISEIAQQIQLPQGALLLHCSGAAPLHAIERSDVAYGVFYPVQTFSATRKLSFDEVPVCLEASTDAAELVLEKLVKKLGAVPCFMNSEQRKVLHLAAVFACNFTNHFYRISQSLLDRQGLPFALLQSLMEETLQKAIEKGPENSQTGPASRKDLSTMAMHEKMLEKDPEWKQLYLKISENILKYN